jgi:hypothetical protein
MIALVDVQDGVIEYAGRVYVEVPDGMDGFQDRAGRLWDILWIFSVAARSFPGSEMRFEFICQLPDDGHWPSNETSAGEGPTQRLVTLKSMIGPADIDDPSPAITILLPDED